MPDPTAPERTPPHWQDAGEPWRKLLGIDGTAGDAQDVPHPYIWGKHGDPCAVCGLAATYRMHTGGIEPTAPAGDLRARLTDAIGPTMRIGLQDAELHDETGAQRINEWITWIGDAVLAVLRQDAGDMAERFAAKLTSLLGHTWCDHCYPADWAGRAGAAMTGVRDEELWRLQARVEFAAGEMASLRDHGTRWETEKARADKAEERLATARQSNEEISDLFKGLHDSRDAQIERARAAEAQVAALQRERERLHTWDGLLELLDEHWPEDIFPTEPDSEGRDPGPRIVSLLRWVERLRSTVERSRAARAAFNGRGVHEALDAWRASLAAPDAPQRPEDTRDRPKLITGNGMKRRHSEELTPIYEDPEDTREETGRG